ncbi:MAG: TonB-dependent receptor plug domain-containing protein [Gemmatimonadota bacterium]|nr:MAG: TonB-dependent receptor plug domain-containing protein [Gemmatimonadota bacterium]
MIAQLMVYALVTATFLALAARAAEAGLRVYGRSARWVWVVALAGSIALLLVGVVAPDLHPVGGAGSLVGDLVSRAETLVLPPVIGSMTVPQPWSARLDVPLLAVWCAMTGGLFVLFLWSVRRLARERRDWERVSVGGGTAWLSVDVGPAVVGIRAASIVVPAWVLELEHDVQRLISLHEEEHLRAADLPLMVGGLFLVVAAPWNPALWYQLRRLRQAVEADCDERMLRRGVDVLAYSSLLLEVGGRSARHHLPTLAFIKKTSLLARRIHLMTWKPRMRLGRAIAGGALAVTFAVLACETPTGDTLERNTPQARLVGEARDAMTVMVRQGEGDEPLFVLDGVVVHTQRHEILETLDPLNIESIQVIKDSVAQRIYGDRATNGIVIITTKKGGVEETGKLQPIAERR